MILSDGTTAVTLDDDMTEEMPYWQPVVQSAAFTLTGSLVLEESVKQAGRPLTFKSEADAGWVPRSAVDQLHAWACAPGAQLTLTRFGADRAVTFRHGDGPAVEAGPVAYVARAPQPDDWMLLTLRLLTV